MDIVHDKFEKLHTYIHTCISASPSHTHAHTVAQEQSKTSSKQLEEQLATMKQSLTAETEKANVLAADKVDCLYVYVFVLSGRECLLVLHVCMCMFTNGRIDESTYTFRTYKQVCDGRPSLPACTYVIVRVYVHAPIYTWRISHTDKRRIQGSVKHLHTYMHTCISPSHIHSHTHTLLSRSKSRLLRSSLRSSSRP